jgi:type I restriction enzyme M protein
LIRESNLGADPEDRDEYQAENIFWVPPEARWEYLQKNAKQPPRRENRAAAATAAIERRRHLLEWTS